MAGSSFEGYDRLHANAHTIRPRIGGGSRKRQTLKTRGRKRGGFVPSVMEGFVSATAKYVAPIALMSMYKYVSRDNATVKHRNRRSKRTRRHRRRV